MSALGIAAAALIILVVGGGIGYYLGRLQQSASSARLEEVETEFDRYRKEVTEHFSETADRFHAIGLQYRDLYDHLAKGSAALCELEALDTEPPFPLVTAARDEDVESPADAVSDDDTEREPAQAAAEMQAPAEEAVAEPDVDETAADDEATDTDEPDELAAADDEAVAAAADEESTDTGKKPDNVVELVRPADKESNDEGEPDSDERTYH